MIPIKFIFYILLISSVATSCVFIRSFLVSWKDDAVKLALDDVKSQQDSITIQQQNNVIKQSANAFTQSQNMIKDSRTLENSIASATTVPEKLKIKYNIIDEINCNLNNFNDNSICTKN